LSKTVTTFVVTEATRVGVIVIDHGWGSRIFDPRGGAEPVSHGVNRNLLVNGVDMDPLSQTVALNTACVRVDPVTVKPPLATADAEA
jgi:formate dehydrogenase